MDTPSPTVPAKTGSNKTLIWVGVILGFCVCVAVVVVLAGGALLNKAKDLIITDPAQVKSIAGEIADYKLPPGYVEQMGMDFGVSRFVVIMNDSPDVDPIIMLMGFDASGTSAEQMQEQLQRTLEQQTGSSGITWDKTEERQMTIRGQDVKVVVRDGHDGAGNLVRQLAATFEGKTDQALVMIQGRVDHWDEEMINDFLASIQ
jgi:hypothetical protein